jgi:hypothetical protein
MTALATLPEPGVLVLRRAGATITVRPALRREPPFDDELDPSVAVGPLDQPLPLDEWRPRPARRSVPRPPTPARRALPDPARWGRRLLVGIIETAAGKRPLHQLSALLSPGVAHGLGADFERAAKLGAPHWTGAATVASVRASEPAERVAELSATLRHGNRVRAVAMRLEVRHGRWCCTRLMLG